MAAKKVLPTDRTSFQIGIITALDVETEAVLRRFDETFDPHGYSYGKHVLDDNSYSTGRIAGKFVVQCQLASIGKLEASITAQHMQLSFDNIELLLLVGVAGGNPWTSDGQPILLGDIALSTHVIEIDSGRLYDDGLEPRRGVQYELTRSQRRVRNVLTKLRISSNKVQLAHQVGQLTSTVPFPGAKFDILYDSNYIHKHRTMICEICQNQDGMTCELAKVSTCQELECETLANTENKQLVYRSIDSEDAILRNKIHFGIVASSSLVIKSAKHRDRICKSIPGTVAFEMEAAGIWEVFPTIVVKGISDYTDAHKDKRWQPYAAARAAACAQVLIAEWVLPEENPIQTSSNKLFNEHWMPIPSRIPVQYFVGYREILERLHLRLLDSAIQQQIIFVLSGMGGIGKTEIILQFLQNPKIREDYWAVFWVDCTSSNSAQTSFDSIGKTLGLNDYSIHNIKSQLANGSRLTLLILDNCDDTTIDYSNKYIPFASHVRIILTSRTQESEHYASYDSRHNRDYEYIEGLSTIASTKLILALSKAQSSRSVDYTATELARVLGNHPLAIRVACSFIRRYTFTMSDYIAQLGNVRNRYCYDQELVQSLFMGSDSANSQYANIFSTFNISVKKLDGWAPDLLDFSACVDRTDISLDIFIHAWLFEDTIEQRALDPITLKLTERHRYLSQLFGVSYPSDIQHHWLSGHFWSQKRIRKLDTAILDKTKMTQTQDQSTNGDMLNSTFKIGDSRIERRRKCLQQGMAQLCEAGLATFKERGYAISLHPIIHAWAKLRLGRGDWKNRILAISGSILALSVGDAVDWHPRSSYQRKHIEAYLVGEDWNMPNMNDTSRNISKLSKSVLPDRPLDWTIIDKCRAHLALTYPLLHMRSSVVAENLRKMIETLERFPQQIVGQLIGFRAKELLYVSLPRDDPNKVELQKTVIESIVPKTDDMAHNLIVAQRNLAGTFLEMGKIGEAIQYLEHLKKHYPRDDWDYDRDLLAIQDLIGIAYRMNGEFARAEDMLQRVVEKRKEFEEENDQLLCSSRTYLADVYNDKLDFTSAINVMEKTLEIMRSSRTEDDHFFLLSQQTAAKAYFGSGDRQRGIELMKKVKEIRMREYGVLQKETIEAIDCLETMQCEENPEHAR